MLKRFIACGLLIGLSLNFAAFASAQQGYEATRNSDPYGAVQPGQFGYWNGVQLLVPFGLPPEREEIALSLWLQLMDVCPECRTAFSPGQAGVGRPYGNRSGDGNAYSTRRDGRYADRPHGNGQPGYGPQGYGRSRGYGQGYDAALGAQSGSVTISAAEYEALRRKAQAYDTAQSQNPAKSKAQAD